MVAPGPPPFRAAMELKFTITPPPRFNIDGATVCAMNQALFTLRFITRSKSFPLPVPDLLAFVAAGQTLLNALHPLPKGIRLLGLGLHNLIEKEVNSPVQLGLAI